jgi:hypothetical protein
MSMYVYGVLVHIPFTRVSIRQYSGDYIYIIIFRNVLLILHSHMFLIESLSLAFIR